MDGTDDLTYLNYLGSKNDTFLLQSTEEALGVQDPTFNSQTIFGELDDGARIWTVDSLPVLLNGSLISDQGGASEIKLQLENNEDSLHTTNENLTYPVEIPGETFITSNGLFLTNEVLLQMNSQNEVQTTTEEIQDIQIENNHDTKTIVNDAASEGEIEKIININELSEGPEVIQLLNADGTVINIENSILINKPINIQENEKIHINELFERITAYKCKMCNYLSETLGDITNHTTNKCEKISQIVIESPNKRKAKSILNIDNTKGKHVVLLCSECNVGYSSTVELKNHMIMSHQFTNSQKKGNKTTNNHDSKKQEYLNIIKSQQKSSQKMKCSIKGCNLRFALDDYRIRHEKCHSQKKQFKCMVCDKLFSIWRVCSLHLWKCHEINVGLLTCVICNYKTFSPHKLWVHMLIHDEKRQYLCSECGKRFKQLAQLQNHKMLHLAKGEGAPNWVRQQRCDICGNIFCDSKSLKKHVQSVHNKFKPYVCNICGHKTARKAMLELHLRQHTGEKPYVCELCPYKTGDHNSLRRHLMVHSGDKKYSCGHCDYQSIQSIAFRHHMVTKHPGEEGIFLCKHCNFQTVNENAHKTHVRQHEKKLINGNKEQEKSVVEGRSKEETAPNNIPNRIDKTSKVEDDDETQHGLLSGINNDAALDTGGVTIPADIELQV